MKEFVTKLSTYLPHIVVQHLVETYRRSPDSLLELPQRRSLRTACLFADVSGFTKLSEALAERHGVRGCQYVAKKLNQYFALMLRHISRHGGDAFKFAGDAVLVIWPQSDNLAKTVHSAVQCAMTLQNELHDVDLGDARLSVKIGIGVGDISVLLIGGHQNRREYVAVGSPLKQAFDCEHAASPGQTVVSKKAWPFVQEFFPDIVETKREGVVLSRGCKYTPVRATRQHLLKIARMVEEAAYDVSESVDKLQKSLRNLIPAAIYNMLHEGFMHPELRLETWAEEVRQVTVLFVNIGLEEADSLAAARYDDAVRRIQDIFTSIQKYEGSLNKFLKDDKGFTLIAIWGLAPIQHVDDGCRGTLAAMGICKCLADLGLTGSVGVTSGLVFCGTIGSRQRRECSVLGDVVNTSARLMSYTQSHFGGGVLVDDATYRSCCDRLLFEKLDPIELKGKNRRVQVYRPTIYDGKTKSMLNMRIREDRFLMVNRLYKEQRVLYAASLRRRLLTSDSSRREFRKQALTPKDAKQMFMIASDRMPVKIMRMIAAISSKSMFESVYKAAPPLKSAPITPSRSNFRRDSVPYRAMLPSKSSSSSLYSHSSGESILTSPKQGRRKTRRRSSLMNSAVASRVVPRLSMTPTQSSVPSFYTNSGGSDIVFVSEGIESVHTIRVCFADRHVVISGRVPKLGSCYAIPGRILWKTIQSTRELFCKIEVMCRVAGMLKRKHNNNEEEEKKDDDEDLKALTRSRSEIAINLYGTEIFLSREERPIATFSVMIARALEEITKYQEVPIKNGVLWLVAMNADTAYRIQSRHTFARQLMVDCESDLQSHLGSIVILEGRIGTGKTALLSEMASPRTPLLWSGRDVPHIIAAAADPYTDESERRFNIWRDVCRQCLQKLGVILLPTSKTNSNEKQIRDTTNRLLKIYPKIDEDILRELSSVNWKEEKKISVINDTSKEQNVRYVVVALLRLVMSLCRNNGDDIRPMILLLDDAQHIDDASWSVLVDLTNELTLGRTTVSVEGLKTHSSSLSPLSPRSSTSASLFQSSRHFSEDDNDVTRPPPLPLMIVIAIRPFSIHINKNFRHGGPSHFRHLLTSRIVQHIKLGSLGNEAVAKILRSATLRAIYRHDKMNGGRHEELVVHESVIETMSDFCDGSPLILRLLIAKLMEEVSVTSQDKNDSDKKRSSLSPRRRRNRKNGGGTGSDGDYALRHARNFSVSTRSPRRKGSGGNYGQNGRHELSTPFTSVRSGPRRSSLFGGGSNAKMKEEESNKDDTYEDGESTLTQRILDVTYDRKLNARVAKFAVGYGVDNMPFASAFHAFFGVQLDKLELTHQLIVKIASVAGDKFTFEQISGVWPTEGTQAKQVVSKGLNVLENEGIVICISTKPTCRFEFVSPLLRRAVLQRMLEHQKRGLLDKLRVWKDARDAKVQEEKIFPIIGAGTALSLPVLRSHCYIEKRNRGGMFSTDWKFRVLELNPNSGVQIRISKTGRREATSVQMAFLQNAEIEALTPEDLLRNGVRKVPDNSYNCGVLLSVTKWTRDNTLCNETRTFKIALPSTHERDKWMQWVEFCIKRIAFRNRGKEDLDKTSKADLGTKMPTYIRPRGFTASQLYNAEKKVLNTTASSDADEDQFCDLVVILHEGTGIRRASEAIVGRDPVSPFASVTLKNQIRRTVVVPADPSPKWDEGFTFRMSRGQSATSHIRVYVYSNDLFGTDDRIGYVDIPLESLRLPEGALQKKRISDGFKFGSSKSLTSRSCFGSSKSLKSRRRARKAKSTELQSLQSLFEGDSDDEEEKEEEDEDENCVFVSRSASVEEKNISRIRARSTPQGETLHPITHDVRINKSEMDVLRSRRRRRRRRHNKTPSTAMMRFSPTSKTPDVTSTNQSMLDDTERIVISTTKWFDLICMNDTNGRARSDSDLLIRVEDGENRVKCGKVKIEIRLLMTYKTSRWRESALVFHQRRQSWTKTLQPTLMRGTSSSSTHRLGSPPESPPLSSKHADSNGLSSLVKSAVTRRMHARNSSSLSSKSATEINEGYKARLVLFSQWLSSSLESGQCPPYSEVERRLHQVNTLSVDSLREL